MKNAIISLVLAIGLIAGTACSTSREVRVTERDDDGVVIKKERRVDEDGVVIKKKRRDRDPGENDRRERDTRVRIKRDRDRDRGILDNDDEPAVIIDTDRD